MIAGTLAKHPSSSNPQPTVVMPVIRGSSSAELVRPVGARVGRGSGTFPPAAGLPDDLTQRIVEESRRAARFALIARVSRIIASHLELDAMLCQAADAIHELLEYENVDIPLLDPHDPRQLVISVRGGDYKRAIRHIDRLPIDGCIMGAAVIEKRSQLVNDVQADPRYVRPPGTSGARAELAVPIMVGASADGRKGTEILGVLNVEGTGPYDELDVASLEVIADHLAVGMQNAQLFEGARRAAVLEERQRLARDLHDSVTQMVASIHLISQSLEPAWRRDPQEGARRAARLTELAASAQAELRALLRELRPPSGHDSAAEVLSAGIVQLRGSGLDAGLRRLLADSLPDGVATRLEMSAYEPQAEMVEEALYRVVQEALANVAKHAAAKNVRVAVVLENDEIHLTVIDDGRGFAVRQKKPSETGGHHLGLLSMRERLEALGGRFEVRSKPGEGTEVHARIRAKPRQETRGPIRSPRT
jgi:two-component system NarL family sensor kinase